MSTKLEVFKRGILSDNPLLRLVLGLCPALAVTTTAVNGLGMGLATTVVLLGSSVLVSLLRDVIPNTVRIPSFIVIIASFVTLVDFVMAAYTPDLHEALGIFIPLIVVNCVVMGRAEAFASKNPTASAAVDAIGMGVGFTWVLLVIASIREILGAGKLFGAALFGPDFQPVVFMILPPGGFIILGTMIALLNYFERRRKDRKRSVRVAELEAARERARVVAAEAKASERKEAAGG